MTARTRSVFVSCLVALLLVEAAWILAVPAFRGIDEFDHVYKAAATARGELVSHTGAPDGRGSLMTVPRDVVEAAHDVCAWYDYTGPDNCNPVEDRGDGLVTVATAASTYNPSWYAVVGLPTKLLHGDGVVYGIRVVAAVLGALLLAWGAALTASWTRSAWAHLGYAVALTPVLTFSVAIASPNGLHYAGAVLTWTALLAASQSEKVTGQHVLAALVGSAATVLTHTSGPIWLVLIALVALAVRRPAEWWAATRGRTGTVLAGLGGVTLVTLAGVAWTRWSGANSIGTPQEGLDPLTTGTTLKEMVLWFFQSIAAFPTRLEPAPPSVYVLWLVPFAGLLVLALRRAPRRGRAALLLVTALSVVVPTTLFLVAYPAAGLSWQGRYGLPLSVGMPLVAGLLLARHSRAPRRTTVTAVAVLLALATTTSLVDVSLDETGGGAPGLPLSALLPAGPVLLTVLALAGSLLLLAPALARTPAREPVGASV